MDDASKLRPDFVSTDEKYVHVRSASPAVISEGLSLYDFGPLRHEEFEIQFVDVHQGHETFQISKAVTRIYYVVSGSGYFTINREKFNVEEGMVIEVPPKVEYSYSGRMKLIVLSTPRWFRGNDRATRWNPDVNDGVPTRELENTFCMRLARVEIAGKSPIRAFLRVNRKIWNTLPQRIRQARLLHYYGELLAQLARLHGGRAQAFGTFFFRNRPELKLIERILQNYSHGTTLKVAVLGCSTGAETYSVAWTIRSARPDLKLVINAFDIAEEAVDFAKAGVYTDAISQLTRTSVTERMTPAEVDEMFEVHDGQLRIKSWLKEGIEWQVADVAKLAIRGSLERQDIVLANNFLCHMDPARAEQYLRNISLLVRPQGMLFVGGIDLDVRTKVARDLGWIPIQDLLEEIHEGDPCLRTAWPCDYTGLEPLDKSKPDWQTRYAAAFRMPREIDKVIARSELTE